MRAVRASQPQKLKQGIGVPLASTGAHGHQSLNEEHESVIMSKFAKPYLKI